VASEKTNPPDSSVLGRRRDVLVELEDVVWIVRALGRREPCVRLWWVGGTLGASLAGEVTYRSPPN
jgi:hypothetical protein